MRSGFELILPFLRPIASLILDPEVSEVMVNGGESVFVERAGELHPVPGARVDERSLRVAVKNIARALGDDISEAQPLLDARLPDGSRVAAVFPPCSVHGTTLTIRKFGARRLTLDDLEAAGSVSHEQRSALEHAVRGLETVLISGGTGSGKTTLLNALADVLPDGDRLVVIEDTAELRLTKPNLVRLEARREQPDLPAVTIRDLVRASLRHRPDRLLIGEVRGAEAFDLLQAWNTGHAGSLSTIHANSAAQAVARFTNCVLQADVGLPYPAVRALIAESVGLLVHLARRGAHRVVTELARVERYEHAGDRFVLTALAEPPGGVGG